MSDRALATLAATLMVILFMLCFAWEWRLAPLRPGGSWLMLKSLPLLATLPGLLRRRRYTYQWASLLSIPYFAEGTVRAASEGPPNNGFAVAEVLLAATFFACAVAYARRTRAVAPPRVTPAG